MNRPLLSLINLAAAVVLLALVALAWLFPPPQRLLLGAGAVAGVIAVLQAVQLQQASPLVRRVLAAAGGATTLGMLVALMVTR